MGSSTLQGAMWGAAARDWAERQEPLHTPLWEAMLDAARVGPGTRVLDAGCGAGGASVLAARRGAHVSGLDAADALVALAGERLPDGDFRVGDLEELPYRDQAFDAVIAANSIMYAADPLAALRELRRVCAPGGVCAVGTWGAPECCEQRDVFAAVLAALPAPPPGESPFALSAPGALSALVEQAGWHVIATAVVACPFEYRDLESYWLAQRSAGPLQAALQALGEAPLRGALMGAVASHRTASGGVRLENQFQYVAASS